MADAFPLSLVSEDGNLVTLSWEPQPGADGYRFYVDGKAVSRTFDPSRKTVRFAKGAKQYGVEVLHVSPGAVGTYPPVEAPPPPPPPPPPGTTMTPSQFEDAMGVDGAVIENVTVNGSRQTVSARGKNVTVKNCRLTNVDLDIDPSANGFKLLGSSLQKGRFNIWGADDGLIEGNTFDNNGCTGHIFFSHFGNAALGSADPHTLVPKRICVRGNTFGTRFRETYVDVNFRTEVAEVGPAATGIKVQPGTATTNPEFDGTC